MGTINTTIQSAADVTLSVTTEKKIDVISLDNLPT
jgi:hypothetical protein